MAQIIGIGLAAGCGTRFRPLSLKAPGYLRAKAVVDFLGRHVVDWLLDTFHQQGVDDFMMITKGRENRYQIKSLVGYGDALGARIRYSPVRYDQENSGSADALLTNLDYFDTNDTVVVFPTDSVFDLDLPAMLDAHRRTGAVVTIASVLQPAESIAGRYGLIDRDLADRVRGFLEKPSLALIREHLGIRQGALPSLPTNAGCYLMDAHVLRAICCHPEFLALRRAHCDIGGNLLPWLVRKGFPVYNYTIDRMGDLGNITSYLTTLGQALNGEFHSMLPKMPHPMPGYPGLMIDPVSLAMTDPHSGLSLATKIARGLVRIEAPVRIGKYVTVYPGATLAACNIDDDCDICEQTTIVRSSIGAGSLIGPGSHLEDSLTGIMVDLHATVERPITLSRYTAIGDEVTIDAGVVLEEAVTVHPRLHVPANVRIAANTDIETHEQLLACAVDDALHVFGAPPDTLWSDFANAREPLIAGREMNVSVYAGGLH